MTPSRLILALETSCDETAAAVVELREGRMLVRSETVITQDAVHAEYGGVVPELASRAHLEKLTPAIRAALQQAGVAARPSLDGRQSGERLRNTAVTEERGDLAQLLHQALHDRQTGHPSSRSCSRWTGRWSAATR